MALPVKNMEMAQSAIRLLLQALGEDPDREGIRDTPLRVAKMYSDILDGNFAKHPKITTFEKDTFAGAVNVHHVPFYAFCEHHLAQFEGHFAMAYVPNGKILGISKLVRIFRHGCKKITIQERITEQAVDMLMDVSGAKGAACYVTATHSCMCLRGVKSPGSMTTTEAYRGVFQSDQVMQQRFVSEASKPMRS